MVNVRASQIFTHTIDDAVAAKKALDAGTDFSVLVEQYSACPSKKQGGDLGWMQENASLLEGQSVEKGQILGPIHSPYGYHLLLITDVLADDAELQNVEMIAPRDLKTRINSVNLLDIRERWEYDIAHIEGSQLITRENCETVLGSIGKDCEIVIVDWKGERSPSFQKWLAQRGFAKVSGMGIDAWAAEIDSRLARYNIDEDKDYRYEDLEESNVKHPDH